MVLTKTDYQRSVASCAPLAEVGIPTKSVWLGKIATGFILAAKESCPWPWAWMTTHGADGSPCRSTDESVSYDDSVSSTPQVRSVSELAPSAATWLDEYCSLSSRYAWPSYDLDLNPKDLLPTDLLSTGLLSYAIRGEYLERMLVSQEVPGPYERLFRALKLVIDRSEFGRDKFEDVAAERLWMLNDSAWGLVVAAAQAVRFRDEGRSSNLTIVAVSKILHRKRPHLVPLIDRRVRKFYGAMRSSNQQLLERLHLDYCANLNELKKWAQGRYLANGHQMTPLRALDIVIWMEDEKLKA